MEFYEKNINKTAAKRSQGCIQWSFRDPESQKRFLRETRSLAVYDRHGLNSKEIALVTISADDGIVHKGIYCLDALGSERGAIITGDDGLIKKIFGKMDVKLQIEPSTPIDVAEWLESKFDPERKALGKILRQSLLGTDFVRGELEVLAAEASKEFSEAQVARLSAERSKKWSYLLATFASALGALIAIGMWEDKFFGPISPIWLAGGTCFAIFGFFWTFSRMRRADR